MVGVSFLTTLAELPATARFTGAGSTGTTANNHFHYACRDLASGFAAAAVFGANTPLFDAVDAFDTVVVATGFWGPSACCR